MPQGIKTHNKRISIAPFTYNKSYHYTAHIRRLYTLITKSPSKSYLGYRACWLDVRGFGFVVVSCCKLYAESCDESLLSLALLLSHDTHWHRNTINTANCITLPDWSICHNKTSQNTLCFNITCLLCNFYNFRSVCFLTYYVI